MPRIWIFGEDVNTDQIVPGRYAPYMTSEGDLRNCPFIEARPEFAADVKPGDILVAGPNFGCGSSREYAARALALCELGAIVAPSFARIFYRNAVNLGLRLIVAPAADLAPVEDGVQGNIDLGSNVFSYPGGGITFNAPAPFAEAIREAGGLVSYFRTNGSFPGEVTA